MLLGLDSQVWQALANIEKKVYFMELRQDAASLSLNDLQRHSAQHRQEIENAATWHEERAARDDQSNWRKSVAWALLGQSVSQLCLFCWFERRGRYF